MSVIELTLQSNHNAANLAAVPVCIFTVVLWPSHISHVGFCLVQSGSIMTKLISVQNTIYTSLALPHGTSTWRLNTLRPRQNGRHFADGTFKSIFVDTDVWIAIEISLKYVPWGRIDNIPALVQIVAWRRRGDKPLPEPMMVQFTDAYLCRSASMS